MSNPNPFGFLDDDPETPAQLNVGGETVNPFEFLDQTSPTQYRIDKGPGTYAGAFFRGTGQGLLHPIKGITGDLETPEHYNTGQKVANVLGEVTGIGLGFIPFLRGSSLALKGVGLAGRTSPAMFRLMEGMVAGGAYEVAAGPLNDTPGRVATGALFGLAGEAAFMGAASAWRATFPKELKLGALTAPGTTATEETLPQIRGLLTSGGRRFGVNPDALRVEQHLRPREFQQMDEILLKLQRIGDQKEQLEYIALEVAQTYRPGGVAIIPGIASPGQMIRHLKRSMPESQFTFHSTGDGLYEVLVHDVLPRERLVLRGPTSATERRSVASFMGPGRVPFTYQEAVNLIKNPFRRRPRSVDEVTNSDLGLNEAGVITRPISGIRYQVGDAPVQREWVEVASTSDGKWTVQKMFRAPSSKREIKPGPVTTFGTEEGVARALNDILKARPVREDVVRIGSFVERGVPVTEASADAILKEFRRRGGNSSFKSIAGFAGRGDDIWMNNERSASEMLETLVHEYMHIFSFQSMMRGGVQRKGSGVIFRDVMEDWIQGRLATPAMKGKTETDVVLELFEEFKEATYFVVGRKKFGLNAGELSKGMSVEAGGRPRRGLRRGEIEEGGAHFSEPGSSTYFDPSDPNLLEFDYTGARIADPFDSVSDFEAIVGRAREIGQREITDPGELKAYLGRLSELSNDYVSYIDVEELGLDRAAKELGFDGIRFWENDDITKPTTVNIWNIGKVSQVTDNFILKSSPQGSKAPTGWGEAGAGKSLREQTKEWIESTNSNQKYYYDDNELMSRLAELMFIDPVLARKIAPNATEAMASAIQRNSPKLEHLLTKVELQTLNRELKGLWAKRGDEVLEFRKLPFSITPVMRAEYQSKGYFKGMAVRVEGREYVIIGEGKNKFGELRVKDLLTGKERTVSKNLMERPLFPTIVEESGKIRKSMEKLLAKPPKWIGVVFRDAGTGGSVKGVIDIRDFDVVPSMGKWIQDNRELLQTQITPEVKAQLSLGQLKTQDVMELALKAKGKKGLVISDEGRHTLFVADESAVGLGDEVLSPEFGLAQDATVGAKWIEVSQENLSRSLLRQAGVPERELEHYMKDNPFIDIARRIMAPEEVAVTTSAADNMALTIEAETVEGAVGRANMRVDVTSSGEYRVLSAEGQELAKVGSADAAREYAARAGAEPTPDLDMGSPIKTDFVPSAGGVPPMPPSSVMPPIKREGFLNRALDSVNLFGSMFTALENWSKSAERQGLGPAFSRVFEPAQKAILAVDRELAYIKRDLLGGKTFNEHLRVVEGLASGMPKERQEAVVRWIEYMSREEIAAPGGLLTRGMSDNELRVANQIISIGLGDDVPRLTKVNSLIRSAEKSQKELAKRITTLEESLAGMAPDDPRAARITEVLTRFKSMEAAAKKTREQIIDELGLTEPEKFAIRLIDDSYAADKDRFSIFAVGRYAGAKPLAPGYKSGRAQYAAEMGMNAKEVKLGEELDRIYKAAFSLSGLDSRRQIGGYWPHMRKLAEMGFTPDEEFIRRAVPDSVDWSSARFRTGELDIYSMDPVMTSYKHVRNMLMKQHFDPILPDIKNGLKEIKERDPRAHKIMSEYVMELMGRPHTSFSQINSALKKSAEVLGFNLPDDFVENFVNGVAALTYGATIPFRPALILRNYFQMWQMIAPRVGNSTFFRGLSRAMTKEGFDEAVKAGVVTANVLPVHATSEVFNPLATTGLPRRMQRLMEKGFKWYQKPDDLGRAAAYHSAKLRITDHIDDVMKGRISYEEFKKRAKVLTYDSIDIAEFDKLWSAGQFEMAADLMGNRLSREAIFRYGHANHPAGWGSVYGRLFGQFGTWPVQYKDFLLQGLTRGTTKDRLEFAAIHGAINVGTVAAGAAAGMNLWSWVSFPALNYTGGPYADMMVNLYQAYGGSPQEQALAKRNIVNMVPFLEIQRGELGLNADPRSIFLPGSYFLGDLGKLIDGDPMGGLGFKMMDPGDESGLEWFLGQ